MVKKYTLNEVPSEVVNLRFARLDLNHFPKVSALNINEKRNRYTQSTHYRNNEVIRSIEDLFKLGKFHRIIQNGVIENVSLGILSKNNIELNEFFINLSKNSDIIRVKFID